MTFLSMAEAKTFGRLPKSKKLLALNLHVASSLESNARATRAKIKVFAKKDGIGSSVIALALATGRGPAR